MKQFITKASAVALLISAGFLGSSNAAEIDVKLTDYLAYIDVDHDGGRPAAVREIFIGTADKFGQFFGNKG